MHVPVGRETEYVSLSRITPDDLVSSEAFIMMPSFFCAGGGGGVLGSCGVLHSEPRGSPEAD